MPNTLLVKKELWLFQLLPWWFARSCHINSSWSVYIHSIFSECKITYSKTRVANMGHACHKWLVWHAADWGRQHSSRQVGKTESRVADLSGVQRGPRLRLNLPTSVRSHKRVTTTLYQMHNCASRKMVAAILFPDLAGKSYCSRDYTFDFFQPGSFTAFTFFV